MKVILLRHAARDFAQVIGDSALSETGRSQAKLLVDLLEPKGKLPRPTALFTSPKKRAKETLTPLAHSSGLPLLVEARLDERESSESVTKFRSRIASVLADVSKKLSQGDANAAIYLCTHADWLEDVIPLIPKDMSEAQMSLGWANAEYRIFSVEDELWRLIDSGVARD